MILEAAEGVCAVNKKGALSPFLILETPNSTHHTFTAVYNRLQFLNLDRLYQMFVTPS
jgi:hypothetical protein